jgi:hypothetical protein
MNGECFDQSEQIRAGRGASRRTLLAALVGASVVLTARGTVQAAGKLGGSSGADEFQISCGAEPQGGKIGGGADQPVTLGGKLGVGTGDD